MSAAFDHIAGNYDESFVNSPTGRLQRKVVWQYLEKVLKERPSLEILELGCGTGEDAIRLARMGHKVIATDISPEMIRMASSKMKDAPIHGSLQFDILDMREAVNRFSEAGFDLIFSDFGAMNCVSADDLKELFTNISPLLKPGGRIIAVIMPRFCLWEMAYFTLKLKFGQIFRRNRKGGLMVRIDSSEVSTWYYSPEDIRRLASGRFKVRKIMPVGISLPPSYLDPYFRKHPRFLDLLDRLEHLFSGCRYPASFSDHYLIDLEVKS